MPKSRIILCLGFFIALLPVLGFPNSWDHFFDTASGLLIVLLSVLLSVDKRLMLKAKAEKRTQRKRALVPTPAPIIEEEPVSMPEPVAAFEPVYAPEPIVEAPMESVHIEEVTESLPATLIEPAASRPRRKRKVNVVDGDASMTPPVENQNDISQF